MIYGNVGAKSIGVDLSQQSRYEKFFSKCSLDIFFCSYLDEINVNLVIQFFMIFDVFSKNVWKTSRIYH